MFAEVHWLDGRAWCVDYDTYQILKLEANILYATFGVCLVFIPL